MCSNALINVIQILYLYESVPDMMIFFSLNTCAESDGSTFAYFIERGD